MSIGATVAAQKVKFRRQFGVQITPISGKTIWVRTRSLEKREHEYLPSGLSNVADADLRVFEASPIDFCDPKINDPKTKVSTWPLPGSLWTWHGISYTVLAVHPGDDELGGVMVTLLLFVYKTPPDGSATAETLAEALASGEPSNAGKRKDYSPLPSTL